MHNFTPTLTEWPFLYRLRSFLEGGVPLAGSSDAPYVGIDPWAAIGAAMNRRTRRGELLGVSESLTPEEAIALYLVDPMDLRTCRTIKVGAPADICLLDQPWTKVRDKPSAEHVRLTMIGGVEVHNRDARL
ncbi:amidohydrolase family protein [Rhizorhapis sp. SPR117]|uniref:amidohydrolase family protein n=1 Tax=Rhizorhapis sp. SPR117 TaxID=2912611 RepID=UPI001F199C40|nr:amidohydrolase family protein [Rhizorhapis sp. SPR117]